MKKRTALTKIREEALKDIQSLVEPRLYESGFRIGKIGESRAYRLFALPEPQTIGSITLIAVTEDGIATDAYGGGLVTESWDTVSTDDLLELEEYFDQLFLRES
jgi:hypothetical protein